MNLQENILRIRQMMGLITENIDDLLDKMSRGEELSKDEKDKMELYSKHIKSGGNDQDFNYEPQVDTQESNDVDYNVLIAKLLYEYYNDMYKDYFYVYGTKERDVSWSLGLTKILQRINNPENEDEPKPTQLNKYIMVGHKDPESGYNICSIVSAYDLLSSEKTLFFYPLVHNLNFKRYIKNYIDTKASQSVKDLYYSSEGPLYDWGENDDYKTENKPRILKVFLKWFKDKFGESFDEGDIHEKGPTQQQSDFLNEFVKENGINGYIKDL